MKRNYWTENIDLCRLKHPYLNIDRENPGGNKRVVSMDSRRGAPTFEYRTDDGKRRYFHSSYDPVSEARNWIEEPGTDRNSIVVVLGVGFFYHIVQLIETIHDDQIIILIERDSEIFREALKSVDLKNVLCRDNLYIFVGGDPAGAINFIGKVQTGNDFKKVELLTHQPSIQTFSEYYKTILHAFNVAGKFNVYERLRYRKFLHREVRVLLLTTQYFLMGEIISAIRRLDIRYRLITIEQDEIGCQGFIEEIIKNIIELRPDFLLTINHLGMDREGMLAQFLTRIEMPFASWYVDNPNLIIKHYRKNVTPYCVMFLWDKNSVHDMKAIGFEHRFYMPLGVDERRFCPKKNGYKPSFRISSDVSFVGNSMVQKVRDRLKKTKANGGLRSCFKDISRDFMRSECRHIGSMIRLKYPDLYSDFAKLDNIDRANYETAINWEATRIYRLERISKLLPFGPLIIGDPYWEEVIDSRLFTYHKEVEYYDELPYVYNVSTINFNATSRQMKGAVNQRVFDVPACNKFLLTDYQEQMEELFNIGEEVVCYREPGEIEELVRYYLDHESERIKIAEKGYQRVIRDHTYISRVKGMVGTMRRIFG